MKKAIVILCLYAVLLTGCSHNTSTAIKDYSSNVTPNIIECGSTSGSATAYYYSIDENTGVAYLNYDAGYRHAITVVLNTDGTPVTAEQLGISY